MHQCIRSLVGAVLLRTRCRRRIFWAGNGSRPTALSKVLPKYRNSLNGSETWAGRGEQPRWVTNLLRSGKRIDDLRSTLRAKAARVIAPGLHKRLSTLAARCPVNPTESSPTAPLGDLRL
ncbi:H-NS family nucleoid-associated regulatory protein [Bradyrhizobium sp. 2TAF36]|uniref:H-NS histone family protein n=1 Tax=Bradyrhizobium sp. 2TAF36 TaxID=3233016 RepID=UPI003F901723